MKLAEALSLRSDGQRRLQELKVRAQSMARYQEGEEPAEDAMQLVDEAQQALDELERLVRQINTTNAVTRVADGSTLTNALARRDVLRLRHGLLTAVADAGAGQEKRGYTAIRQTRTELKFVSAVPVADLRHQADELARQLRELDAQIQQTDWGVDLIES